MKKLLIATLFAIATLTGCSGIGSVSVPEIQVQEQTPEKFQTLIEGRLYFIPHKENTFDFPESYKKFLEENPKLVVDDVETIITENTSHTAVLGYYVFTKESEED